MKKLLTTGLCLTLASIGGAEVIRSVNFNPARFGQYERLKISEQATLKGGLSAQSMRVNAAGTVTLTQTPSSGQGRLAYDILKLDAARGYSSWGSSFPSTPTLDFPSTCFSSLESCVNSTDTGALNVKFQEGSARFIAPSGYSSAPSSRIHQITTAADILRLEAVYATIQGKLNVTGSGSYSFRNVSSPSTPLRLAGNWITLPSQGGGPTNGTLKWEERKTVRYADRGGDTVYVLALKGKKSVSCNKTCHDGNCPSGYTGKITYRLNTTTCSCEVASNTCKPNEKYEWVSVQSGAVPFQQQVWSVTDCRTTHSTPDLPEGYNVYCEKTSCSSSNVGKYCSNVEIRQINYHGNAQYQACYYHVFRCEKKYI